MKREFAIDKRLILNQYIDQKVWISGSVELHPGLNCVEQVLPENM